MKRWLLASLLLPACALAQSPNPLFADGVEAYKKGDYTTARQLFETVVAQNPRDTAAQNYLKMISSRMKGAGGGNVEAGLKTVNVPSVSFTDSSIRDAMAYLSQQVKSISKGSQILNVVWLVPEGYDKRVTLNLQNIPASEVMKYLAEAGGLELAYDAHAVKVTLPKP